MDRKYGLAHLPVLALLLVLLSGCAGARAGMRVEGAGGAAATLATAAPPGVAPAQILNVFAASSLTNAFDTIGKRFEAQNPGVTVSFNYAGSNQLAQQIAQGAPADVFAPANMQQMDTVIESGQVADGSQRTFVRNRLVVIYPRENPAHIAALKDLATPRIKIVFAAREVPVGQYSLDFLEKASQLPEYTAAFSETVAANVVSYEENVRVVLSKVSLGEADAGIVYMSDLAGDQGDQVGRIDIPDELNTIATYPIAPVVERANSALAGQFVEYVLSPEAQTVLQSYGFIPVTNSEDGATSPELPNPDIRGVTTSGAQIPGPLWRRRT